MSDISTHYGGSLLALKGKNSIVLVEDKRLGMSSFTVNTERTKVVQINKKAFLGFTGFLPDAQELVKQVKAHVELFELNVDREMDVVELKNLISFMLYEKRLKGYYYIAPMVVGFDDKNEPRAFSMDCLGCSTEYNYVTTGTAEHNLTGLAETLFVEGMDSEGLFTCAVQIFLNAVDRDALSGWGADCFIIEREKVTKRTVEGRND